MRATSLLCLTALTLLAACAPAPAAVRLPKPPPSSAPLPASPPRAKLGGPTIAMRAEREPTRGAFLPDGRFITTTGTFAYIADPRASSLGVRRIPFAGVLVVSPDGKRFFRATRGLATEIDGTTLADVREHRVATSSFTLVPNHDGSRLLVIGIDRPIAPTRITLLDTSTFRPVHEWEVPGHGTGGFSDDERYVYADGMSGTFFEVATGKEALRTLQPVPAVVHGYAVYTHDRDFELQHLGTLESSTLAFPCQGAPSTFGDQAVWACGSKLAVLRIAPKAKPAFVGLEGPIASVTLDADHGGFRATLASGKTVIVSRDKLIPSAPGDCQSRDGSGKLDGTGKHFCRATVSLDRQWLVSDDARGIAVQRASDGASVVSLPWPTIPPDPFVVAAGNRLFVWPEPGNDRDAEGAPRREPIPFVASQRVQPSYIARHGGLGLTVFGSATRKPAGSLPFFGYVSNIAGDGDNVVVTESRFGGPKAMRCSLSEAKCKPLEGAPCAPLAFAEGRGLCVGIQNGSTTLTRFTIGDPSRTRTLTIPELVIGAQASGSGFVLEAHREADDEPITIMAHLLEHASTPEALEWTRIPGRVIGVESDVAVSQRSASAYELIELGTRRSTVIVVHPKGAVKVHPDGYVSFFGDRAEGEKELLCLEGDRVLPWARCRNREVPW